MITSNLERVYIKNTAKNRKDDTPFNFHNPQRDLTLLVLLELLFHFPPPPPRDTFLTGVILVSVTTLLIWLIH